MVDTIDLVPIGTWWGQGRKKNWLSPWLLAVYDPDRGTFASICRCMSGFSDAFCKAATWRFLAKGYYTDGPKPCYSNKETPSVWFEAREVWEVKGAELTLSPVHLAGFVDLSGGRGLGRRFPRFVRVREYKAVEEATNVSQVVEMFHKQIRRKQ